MTATPTGRAPSGVGTVWSGQGLLEQIADSALDDDYYVFRGSEPTESRFTATIVAVLLTLFALFVTTAALQTRNDRPATELERRTLAADIEQRQQVLDERRAIAAGLSAEVESMRRATNTDDDVTGGLGVIAASEPVRGPGIIITADGTRTDIMTGRITDRDLQVLVNGLWYAGAEAVSVNGKRIGTLSSIRTAGDAITVNFRSISPPYRVAAIGDEESLQTRFAQNPAGAYWEARQKRAGVAFDVTPSSEVTMPATPEERLELTHATSLEVDR